MAITECIYLCVVRLCACTRGCTVLQSDCSFTHDPKHVLRVCVSAVKTQRARLPSQMRDTVHTCSGCACVCTHARTRLCVNFIDEGRCKKKRARSSFPPTFLRWVFFFLSACNGQHMRMCVLIGAYMLL